MKHIYGRIYFTHFFDSTCGYGFGMVETLDHEIVSDTRTNYKVICGLLGLYIKE